MRLVLDEHYSMEIAQRLREDGYDVIAVAERSDLRACTDDELLYTAAAEHRAILTENVRDFVRHATRRTVSGELHYGILISSPRSMPRAGRTIGLFVRALARFLDDHPAEDALVNQVQWLRP